jgi:hypothetical protein
MSAPTVSSKVILDSISPEGIRLPTVQLRFPRIMLPEFNTHRAFTRNARSTRAVPTDKLIREVRDNPYIPMRWGLNQPGMQAGGNADEELAKDMELEWRTAARDAARRAENLFQMGLHKQWAGRLLEPFMYVDVLLSSTDLTNFMALRDHDDAQDEIFAIANSLKESLAASTPKLLQPGEWHMPYIDWNIDVPLVKAYLLKNGREVESPVHTLKKISVARCARLSYTPFDGNPAIEKEVDRFEKLMVSRPVHASPAEHVATPDRKILTDGVAERWEHPNEHGNFYGFRQFRKMIDFNTIHDR